MNFTLESNPARMMIVFEVVKTRTILYISSYIRNSRIPVSPGFIFSNLFHFLCRQDKVLNFRGQLFVLPPSFSIY
jgi:hypothetical protein